MPSSLNTQPPNTIRFFLKILLPFAFAHFLSYLYRTINTVIYPDLAQDLSLKAGDIGLLTGAYFLTFASAQLPIGMALDRYGPRKVQIPMLILAAVGSLIFSQAQSLIELAIARGLIGLGVAGSLMAAIKASSLWLPKNSLPLATSILLSVGGMGAMASTVPMHLLLNYVHWRGAFVILAILTVLASLIIFFIVPEHKSKQQKQLNDLLKAVGQLYTSWSFWRLSLYSIFAHATYMAMQGLWISSWLRDVAHLQNTEIPNVLMLGTLAMTIGYLTFGGITDYLRRIGFKPIFTCGMGILFFILFQIIMISGNFIPPTLVAIGFSFFGAATTMNYAIIVQSVPNHLTGSVSTSFNLIVFLLAFVIQWGFGIILSFWVPINGIYPESAYSITLSLNLIFQLAGMLLWLSFRPWKRELPIFDEK